MRYSVGTLIEQSVITRSFVFSVVAVSQIYNAAKTDHSSRGTKI